MGRIFDRFGQLTYATEADVSHRFVLPVLTEFLGYARSEVLAEHSLPAFDIPQNRRRKLSTKSLQARPDFAVAVEPIRAVPPIALVDAKAPSEDLDAHRDQLRAYCLAAGTNLLIITNGQELRAYDAAELVFIAKDVADLDLRFAELESLLGRQHAVTKGLHARLIELPPVEQRGKRVEHSVRARLIANSDFVPYLRRIQGGASSTVMLPSVIADALGGRPQRVRSTDLLRVRVERGTCSVGEVLARAPRTLIIGESGIGKSTLLQELLEQDATRCLEGESTAIPVFLRLGEYVRSRSFEAQIQEVLGAGGVDLSTGDVRGRLQAGRFHLLLDAYDEAFSEELPFLARTLPALFRDYAACPVTITTRRVRVPSALGAEEYELAQLSLEEIRKFVSAQLGDEDSWAFLEELRRKRLVREASNTLMLSLMILLFQRSRSLPRSRRLILDAMLDAVSARERKKPARFSAAIEWRRIEDFLGALAFRSFLDHDGYQIDEALAEKVLFREITAAEETRQIPIGLTTSHVIDQLAATGFLAKASGGLVFWHRAVMEHFASREAARLIDRGELDVADIARQLRWSSVLPSAVARCSNPATAIERTARENIFAAARCNGEQPDIVDASLRRRMVSRLLALVQSPFLQVRREGIAALRLLPWSDATAALRSILETGEGQAQVDALHELAVRDSKSALELVELPIAWRYGTGEPDALTSSAARIAALGESTSEDAQDRILTIWGASRDMFADWESRRALLQLWSRRLLSQATINRLVGTALSDSDDVRSQRSAIADILATVKEPSAIRGIIDGIMTAARPDSFWDLECVLEAVEAEPLRKEIFDAACNQMLSARRRETFARVLSRMKGIPSAWYRALYADSDLRIRGFGLAGLRREPFADIADLVDRALNIALPDGDSIADGYDFLQACAFDALAEAGRLELLLDEAHRRFPLTRVGAHRLATHIARQRLSAFVPMVARLLERLHAPALVVDLCFCLAELGAPDGEARLAQVLLEGDQFQLAWALERAPRLTHDRACEIVRKVWHRIIEGTWDSDFLHDRCVEAMERLGMREQLKDAVYWSIENDRHGLRSERALRGMLSVAGPSDEEWAISMLALTQARGGSVARALQLLGQIGGQRAIEMVMPFLGETWPPLRNVAFIAIQNIHHRVGVVWWGDVERLPDTVP